MRVKKATNKKHSPYLGLKGVLAGRGLNQGYIADLLHLAPGTVSQKISGSLDFSFDEVKTICDDLGISTEVFRGQEVS